jgi:NAD(P)-dependent dehydrogenase (short-subunit alcohol dehydrogenase family)
MAVRVEGMVSLITGGGSGIGKAAALMFGREGAEVVVADYERRGRRARSMRRAAP